ncbi:hypothetical protein FOI68_17115 [Brevibacillus sp. LEMMJ03]|uniref:protein-export chaperone SecB n=1 Tax=Brevibacillus sp. LEMMJ03 TaxID=2595056 RepID=UPI0011811193|nr:protein-export chaperone SecB [Brevibacillus sp. LEMMJ03]MCG5026961.1 protein-export chaperone SecB [Anoxybacillus flavithermus]TRY24372.1 hypothetical protein FOI68_17115 [Brevibacillus sp. LEMMJ03]
MGQAVFQLRDYHVIETVYKFDPFFNDDDSEKLTPKFSFASRRNLDDPTLIAVELGITIGDEELDTTSLFVSAKILGIFQIVGELEEKEVIKFTRLNAVALLYPYLRALISDLTSKGSEAPIILPTMNIAQMMERVHGIDENDLKQKTEKKST